MAVPDRVNRAMTTDGAFRVIAAITTETARAAAEAQGLGGADALRLAELITGAVLLRETTQPGRRVQILCRDRRGAVLVADSLPDGTCRGIVNPGTADSSAPPEGDTILQVSYTAPSGALHQGLVAVPDGTDLSSALMRYMQQSEQTVSVIGLKAIGGEGEGEEGEVLAVGGYLVQLLPEADRQALLAMTVHLDQIGDLEPLLADPKLEARGLVGRLLEGFEHAELADSALAFGCTCSEERILLSMASLGAEEAGALADDNELLEVRCDACGRRYTIEPRALRSFLENAAS